MSIEETIQVITLLAGNYDIISNKTKDQKQLMVNTWYECLNDLDYNLVLQAVKKTIIQSPYPPTIHEIRKNAIEISNPNTNTDGITAWNEAYKMICNGSYMTKQEFEKHSPEVQKFFGSVNNLQSYSRNTDFNMDVVRSNFLKQYDIISKREQEEMLLPEKMRNLISQVTNRIGLVEGG